jgi:DNA-binding MarR family transcriptional regulator
MATSANRSREAARVAGDLRVVLGRLVRRLRREYSFPISHAAVLSRLDLEGPQTTSALARAERMRPQSMAQTLSELQSEGFLARRPDPRDGRRTLIELTPSGRERLREERRRREGWLTEAILRELTPGEQRTLVDALPLLERIARS